MTLEIIFHVKSPRKYGTGNKLMTPGSKCDWIKPVLMAVHIPQSQVLPQCLFDTAGMTNMKQAHRRTQDFWKGEHIY